MEGGNRKISMTRLYLIKAEYRRVGKLFDMSCKLK